MKIKLHYWLNIQPSSQQEMKIFHPQFSPPIIIPEASAKEKKSWICTKASVATIGNRKRSIHYATIFCKSITDWIYKLPTGNENFSLHYFPSPILIPETSENDRNSQICRKVSVVTIWNRKKDYTLCKNSLTHLPQNVLDLFFGLTVFKHYNFFVEIHLIIKMKFSSVRYWHTIFFNHREVLFFKNWSQEKM